MFRMPRPSNLAVIACCLFLALWVNRAVWAEEARPFENTRIARVGLKTQTDLNALEATGANIINCIPGVGPMDVAATSEQLRAIERLGLPVQVLVENFQDVVDAYRAPAPRGDPFETFFLAYHEYGSAIETGTIVWYMNELVSRYPGFASMVNVGTTVEGRTIWGLRITNDAFPDKPGVVYFGCEHAREWITSTAPTYFATHLLENYGSDPLVTELVDRVEFFLIPVFNVDGYVYSWTAGNRLWRKNRRDNGTGFFGVDLNRNWAEGWGGEGSSGDSWSDIYRGPIEFSEPETQALRDFFLAHPNIRAQLDIHSYTQLILWPFGYTPTLPVDQDVYEDVGFAMQSLIAGVHGLWYTAGPIYSTIYPASGISLDWTYAQLDVLSYSFELRDEGFYGFELPPDQIIPNNEEILPAILHLTNSEWVRPVLRIEFPDGLPDLLTPGEPTDITVQIVEGDETYVTDSGMLHHRYDGGVFISSPLVPLGGEFHRATLPAAGCDDTPEFYFSAEGTGSGIVYEPSTAPANPFTANVGELTVIMSDDMETNQGWTVGAPGDDATTGVWVRVDPIGTAAQPEDDHTSAPGTMCFVTGQGSPGGSVGENDVDGGRTTLISPTIDLFDAGDAGIGYWRWFSNNQGASPQSDIFEVEISNNDGATWINVETVGPSGGEAQGGWYYHEVLVSDFVTPTAQVKVRFIASDEGSGSIVEAAVDDFSVSRLECVPGEETCVDGIQNQGEDRIDCGGPCPVCECTTNGACDDGEYCTGDETCDAFGACQSSGDPCTDPNFPHCNEGGQSCNECLTAIHCDDEIACTVDECQSGSCANTADDGLCDDGDLCTTDTCDGAMGCAYEYHEQPFGDLAAWFAWEPGAPRQPDLDDFLCLLEDLANGPEADLCPGSDLAPCGGDGVIGVDDIVYFLDAFGGNPPCPSPCPP